MVRIELGMNARAIIYAALAAAALILTGLPAPCRSDEAPGAGSPPAPAVSPAPAGPGAKDEGKAQAPGPVRINKITLTGCKRISCRTVRSILLQEKTPWYRLKLKEGGFDQFWAEGDRGRIEQFYKSRGFYSVKVAKPVIEESKNQKGVKISYAIEEGDPVTVSGIEIVFTDGLDEPEDPQKMRKRLKFKAGDRFELEPYQDSAAAMEDYWKDEGFYRVQVDRRAVVDPAAETAEVTYSITHGPRYRIIAVKVEGCRQTDPRVVEKALTIKPRDWYNRSQVIQNQRQVQRLPIYKSVRVIEDVDDEKHKISLTYRVEEGKPREYKVGVGYGSEEGVRVQGSWTHVNFLGGARELTVSARWSELLEKEGITFLQPNIRKVGDFISLTTQRVVEHEEAYTHEAVSLIPTYHFILTHYLWAEVSYTIENNHVYRVQNLLEIKQEDLAKEGLLSALSGRLEWADVNDPVNPRQGARAGLYLEYAGGPLGGDFSYLKIVGEARGYYPVYGPVVGALRWKLGWSEPEGDLSQIPIFKRFFTGGTGSVRGFDRYQLGPVDKNESPIGGSRLWEGSFELRFPVSKSFGGVLFLDSGWVWPEGENYNPSDVMYSTGFGVRYNTAIGPLAFDLGFPLTGESQYSKVKLHFNIGNTF